MQRAGPPTRRRSSSIALATRASSASLGTAPLGRKAAAGQVIARVERLGLRSTQLARTLAVRSLGAVVRALVEAINARDWERLDELACAAMFAPTRHLLPRPAFDVETEAPCGTSVGEAREALAFWRGRLKRLPWYRRAARAEARAMVARWQRRMVQAELERWQLRGLARPLIALIDWWGPTRSMAARRITTHVLRASPLARIVALAAAAVTVTAVAVLALVVIAISQLV
jgi:hypothetical protein